MADKYLEPGERLGDSHVTDNPRHNPPTHGGGGPAFAKSQRLGDTNVPNKSRYSVTVPNRGGPRYHRPTRLGQDTWSNNSTRFNTGK